MTKLIFLLAYRHGLRASEVGLLRKFDLDLKTLRVMIHRKKGSLSGKYPLQADERQRALALELANKESEKRNFQYICMLNFDMLPTNDFSKDFDIMKFVRLRLTGATENGGLLGIRF